MSNLALCRVCLSHNIRMHPIGSTRYQEMYEKHTGAKLNTRNLPNTICYLCNSQLLKFYKFLQMSEKAEMFLTKVYRTGLELTQENVRALGNKLASFSVTTLRSMSIAGTMPVYEVEVITPVEDLDATPDEDVDVIPDDDTDVIPDDVNLTPDENIDLTPDKNVDISSNKDVNITSDQSIDITPDENVDLVTLDEDAEVIAPDEVVDVKIESVDYKEIDLADTTDAEDASVSETNCNDSVTLGDEAYLSEIDEDFKSDASQITIEIEAPAFTKYNNPMEYLIEKNRYSTDHKFPDVTVALERIPITSINQHSNKRKKQTSAKGKQTLNKKGNDKIQFDCKECGYKCLFKSILAKHMKIHSSKGVYSCKICNHRFRTIGNLCKHKKNAHKFHSECPVCSKEFTKLVYLQKHIRIHMSRQPYKCEMCDRKFHHRSTFLVHTRTHTGEKPFHCKWCEKKFNDKSNCRKHMKTHTGTVTKYPCFLCDRIFSQRSHLKKHAVDHIL